MFSLKRTLSLCGLAGALILSVGTNAEAARRNPFCQGYGLPARCSVPLGEVRYYRCTQCDKDQVLKIVGGHCPTKVNRTCGCVSA